MKDSKAASDNNAPGVHVLRNEPAGIEYIGDEKSLVDSGIAQAAWFVDLRGWRRVIAKNQAGEFIVVGEGKGNRLTNQHKENGAYSIGRNRDGSYSVFAYHPPAEFRRRKALENARREAEYEAMKAEQATKEQQTAWLQAKEARAAGDFPKRWKDGVMYHLEQLEKLVTGRMVFTDFPDVGLPVDEIAVVSAAAAELRRVLQNSQPMIKDRVQVSNVVSLNAYAYRNMKRG